MSSGAEPIVISPSGKRTIAEPGDESTSVPERVSPVASARAGSDSPRGGARVSARASGAPSAPSVTHVASVTAVKDRFSTRTPAS